MGLGSAGCARMMGPVDAYRRAAPLAITTVQPDFGKVPVGTYASQVIQVRPAGDQDVTIRSISVTGRGFTVSGPAVPVTIAAGSAVLFSVAFRPTAVGADSGTVLIRSDVERPAVEAAVSGTGVKAEIDLTASPAEIDFGTVSVGHTKASTVTLKAAGNADLEILHIITSGRGFHVAGASDGTKLAPGQDLSLKVTFEPSVSGTANGSVAIYSNASASPIDVRLSGSAPASSIKPPSVRLLWDQSSSSGVVGYYVYRSSSQTGPFSKLDESPEASTSYTDTSVSPGTTYFYKVTSVDSEQVESSFSKTVSATVPE